MTYFSENDDFLITLIWQNYIVYLSRVTDRCPSDLRLYLLSCPIKRDFKLRGTFNATFWWEIARRPFIQLDSTEFFSSTTENNEDVGKKTIKTDRQQWFVFVENKIYLKSIQKLNKNYISMHFFEV